MIPEGKEHISICCLIPFTLKIASVAEWYCTSMSRSGATFPHHPIYTITTTEYNILSVFLLRVPPGPPAVFHQCTRAHLRDVLLGVSFPCEPPIMLSHWFVVALRFPQVTLHTLKFPHSKISGHERHHQPRYISLHTGRHII